MVSAVRWHKHTHPLASLNILSFEKCDWKKWTIKPQIWNIIISATSTVDGGPSAYTINSKYPTTNQFNFDAYCRARTTSAQFPLNSLDTYSTMRGSKKRQIKIESNKNANHWLLLCACVWISEWTYLPCNDDRNGTWILHTLMRSSIDFIFIYVFMWVIFLLRFATKISQYRDCSTYSARERERESITMQYTIHCAMCVRWHAGDVYLTSKWWIRH